MDKEENIVQVNDEAKYTSATASFRGET